MKGITIITEVIFLAIIISMIFLVYTMASPTIQSMQASSAFVSAKSFMVELDDLIQEVASGGKGGRRSLYATMGAGTLLLNESGDSIVWHLDTDFPILSPRSMQRIGSLIAGSNLDVMAYQGSYQGTDAYVLENQHLRVFIKKIDSPTSYNTSELLMGVFNKKLSGWMPLTSLEISVDKNPNSTLGTGYTEFVSEGYTLPSGKVLAHINTTYPFMSNYTIAFTLESGADFLIVEAES